MTDKTIDPRVHAGETRYVDRELHWREDGTCSYCGSMSPEEAMRRLRTPGTHFSGTDKTGYKAYIDPPPGETQWQSHHRKFYFRHLRALDDAKLAEFAARSRKVLGWDVRRAEDGGIDTFAPRTTSFYGFQTFGIIGPDGEPVFGDGSPEAPPEEWWKR